MRNHRTWWESAGCSAPSQRTWNNSKSISFPDSALLCQPERPCRWPKGSRPLGTRLTLNEKTWQLRLPKLTSFGHDLTSKGIAPSKEKVSAVQNANSPQSIAEITSSLGLVQYCAKFLPSFPAQNADEKRPTIYVGRRLEEILPLMERSANTSRNTCLLQEWMEESHCCWCWSHRHRSCPHIATRWPVESNFLCILTDVERSYSLALVWACRRDSSCMFLVESSSWSLTISIYSTSTTSPPICTNRTMGLSPTGFKL